LILLVIHQVKAGIGQMVSTRYLAVHQEVKGFTMATNIQLVPAYGRDYKTQAEVLADWNANKDFWTADIIHGYGVATNKQDCDSMGLRVVIRYANKQKLVAVK
jgi:hypothetical protein